MPKLRRNDIVMEKLHDGYTFYARVWRLIDSETVEIINTKGEVYVYLMDDLQIVPNYKGYWENRKYDPNLPDPWNGFPGYWHQFIFHPMTSLRKLKIRAWWYHPHVLPKRKPRS